MNTTHARKKPESYKEEPNSDTVEEESQAEKQNHDKKFVVTSHETEGLTGAERTTEEVRQGHTGDHVRYILAISFGVAFIVLLLAYWIFAA